MMIIKVNDGSYDEYEQLLLRRDHYRKEAGQILISYTKEFGELINAVFEKKIECIRLKKSISLCQTFINRAEAIDADKINAQVQKEMALYYEQLKEMLAGTRAAKESTIVPAAVVVEIKRVYRKLAKLLHPDINPMTNESQELKDLWNRITIAYHSNNLEELRELEVLAFSAADKFGTGEITIDIPDIAEKIGRLEREINEIITTEPYTYKKILENPAQVSEKKEALQAELEEYEEYSLSLQKMLDELLMKTGRKITWRTNLQ